MNIRKATLDDYGAVSNFEKKVSLYHVENRPDILKDAPDLSKKEFRRMLKSKNWIILVAEDNGKTMGYCKTLIKDVGNKYWTSMKLLSVYDLYVDSEFRHNGVATELLNEIKTIGKQIGAAQIDLEVWSFNQSAINLYKKTGFTPQRTKMELKL